MPSLFNQIGATAGTGPANGGVGTGGAAVMASPVSGARLASEAVVPRGSTESVSAAMAEALAMQAAPELLEALQALSSEKSRLEAQLLDEQSTLEKQLQELHSQMAQ